MERLRKMTKKHFIDDNGNYNFPTDYPITEDDEHMIEMIVCPHCHKCIKFRLELIDGTMPGIDQISTTTSTEFNLVNDGK